MVGPQQDRWDTALINTFPPPRTRFSRPRQGLYLPVQTSPVIPASCLISTIASSVSSPSSTAGIGSTPTLDDILSDKAPPPWTLASFLAYLSRNHCLETLEFTMDAQRYTASCAHMGPHDAAYVVTLWDKLIDTYIAPCAPRELNLPSCVRNKLLGLQAVESPPSPSRLVHAIGIVYNLMNDSLLQPFLQSPGPATPQSSLLSFRELQRSSFSSTARSQQTVSSRGCVIIRSSRSSASSTYKSSLYTPTPPQHPIWAQSPQILPSRRRDGSHSPADSLSSVDVDRGSPCSAGDGSAADCLGTLTPPATPPTPDPPPLGFQRVVAAVNGNAWKKVKFGLFKRSKSTKVSP